MALSANEQLLLELINRSRLDPLAEAARYGIDLNQGLQPGTLDGTAKQVLAANDLLNIAAEGHAQWMLNTDTFDHTGQGGSSPGDRMASAGYSFTGSWTWGENISWRGTTGTPDLEGWIYTQHEGLFRSSGHRENLLNGTFREVGLSQEQGVFTTNRDYNASMVVEKFAKSGSAYFITGVAYNDTDTNAFYTPGEGIGSLQVSVAGGPSGSTEGAGGYALATTSGTHTVTLGSGPSAVTVDLHLANANAKLDLVDGGHVLSSASIDLVAGASAVTLLGVADLNATGAATGETLNGNSGANVLNGAAGDDTLVGANGADTLSGGQGRDALSGGWGDDLLYGQDAGDNIWGGGGNDTLEGANGWDNLWGGAGNDILSGGWGNDRLFGQDGGDRMWAGGGSDTLDGGNGWDNLWGGSGNDEMSGGLGSDRLYGQDGGDNIWAGGGNDTVDGGSGWDKLWGGSGADAITGGWGNDVLYGQDGSDTLTGNQGDDLLVGGAANDTFVFSSGGGNDTVSDFAAGAASDDILDVSAFSISSLAQVAGLSSQVNADTVIDFDASTSVTLLGVNLVDLHEDDFLFA